MVRASAWSEDGAAQWDGRLPDEEVGWSVGMVGFA
jgi:hypothetical protein